jgi:hypothetical protein
VIARLWQGATRPENADAYAAHLRDHILPELAKLPGWAGAFVMRRPGPRAGDDVAYAVMTLWFSERAVRAFAGDDVEAAVVPPEALALLSAHDERAVHWELPLARIVVALDNIGSGGAK